MDGHLDFRHPGNSELVGAAAGADLALVTGRGPDRIADIDGLGPLVRDGDVIALGEREDYPEWRDIHETDITVLESRRATGARVLPSRAEVRRDDGDQWRRWVLDPP
jgi:arginase